MDGGFSAYRWLLKYSQVFMMRNLVSPLHPQYLGRILVRENNDAAGRGDGKKQMATCNELYRGYASARKGADLPVVFHCMNRDKPKNVRQSITLSSEILTDTFSVLLGCKLELQRQSPK